MTPEKLQEKAEKHYVKGKWPKALDLFLKLKEHKPADLRIRLKIAETLLRLQRTDEARVIFRQVADLYVEDGQLHKAIAVNHRLLELDRDDREVQMKLSSLYERHGKGQMRELPQGPREIDAKLKEICEDNITQSAFELEKKLRQEMTRSDWKAALETAIKLWDVEPRNTDHRVAIAQVLKKLERRHEAEEVFLGAAHLLFRQGKPLRSAFMQAELGVQGTPTNSSNGNLYRRQQEIIKNIAVLCGRQYASLQKEASGIFRKRSAVMEEMIQELLIEPLDAAAIRPLPLLSCLPRKDCESLISQLIPQTFAKGQTIFKAQEPAESLLWVSHGSAGLYPAGAGAKPDENTPLRKIEETELLGAFGFLFDDRFHLDAVALNDVEILSCPRTTLNNLQKAHPALREAIDDLYKGEVLPALLSCSPFFKDLAAEKLLELAAQFKAETFAPRELELREGTRAEKLYLLREGSIEVYWGERYGKTPLMVLGPGSFVGLLESLGQAIFPATYRNSGKVSVLSLSQTALMKDSGIESITPKAALDRLTHYLHLGLSSSGEAGASSQAGAALQALVLERRLA